MKRIALLFTILCAGALNGMENSEQKQFLLYGDLPQELRAHIISSIPTYDDLDAIINTIKTARLANKEINSIINKFGTLPRFRFTALVGGFTALVGALEEKFPDMTRKGIADK